MSTDERRAAEAAESAAWALEELRRDTNFAAAEAERQHREQRADWDARERRLYDTVTFSIIAFVLFSSTAIGTVFAWTVGIVVAIVLALTVLWGTLAVVSIPFMAAQAVHDRIVRRLTPGQYKVLSFAVVIIGGFVLPMAAMVLTGRIF